MPDKGLRLVWRVADMQDRPWPGLVIRACSRCGQPVYVDTGQAVPAEMADAALLCVPCGLADPALRPWIESVHRDVRAAALWAGEAGGSGA